MLQPNSVKRNGFDRDPNLGSQAAVLKSSSENWKSVCEKIDQKGHVEKLFGNVLIWRVLEVCNTIWAVVLLGHRYAQLLCDTTLNQ